MKKKPRQEEMVRGEGCHTGLCAHSPALNAPQHLASVHPTVPTFLYFSDSPSSSELYQVVFI